MSRVSADTSGFMEIPSGVSSSQFLSIDDTASYHLGLDNGNHSISATKGEDANLEERAE